MELITAELRERLIANAKASKRSPVSGTDPEPVLKLFTPWAGATWLITELVDEDIMFGLCDLGMGEAELGYVSLSELQSIKGPFGLRIERDIHFEPNGKKLSDYTREAHQQGRIYA